ncbi:MAG: WYL domain-containing protein [Chloroflexi bacterium]|nr:WYL domain-containing protein [Chloroflexota bacterium]
MNKTIARGDRNPSWLVVQRGLAIICRLMRGPATKANLLAAVNDALGPDAYSDSASAAERALKNDRALLKEKLGIEIIYDRRAGVYRLESLGDAPWLDLTDDELAAIATIYQTFAGGGPEAERVQAFLDHIAGLLPVERLSAIRRPALSIELREVDERPVVPRVLETVQRAAQERRRLGFRYQSTADEMIRYHEVEPYGVLFRRGHYYLEAFDLFSRSAGQDAVTHGRVARFRLQGIADDELLRALPERLPPGRRPQKRYALRYRLAPPAIRHGVSRHFADMTVERLPDGAALIQATVTDPWDAVYTLLSYGENCTVLGGDEVLSLMRKRVAGMAKNYDLLAFEVG